MGREYRIIKGLKERHARHVLFLRLVGKKSERLLGGSSVGSDEPGWRLTCKDKTGGLQTKNKLQEEGNQ